MLVAEYYPAGFVGVRIFRSGETPNVFALIETWTSAASLDAARRTPAYPVLERFERNLTLSTLDCGAFAVPTAGTDDRDHQADPAMPGALTRSQHCAAPRWRSMRRPKAIAHFKRKLVFDYHPWRPFMKFANFRFLSIVWGSLLDGRYTVAVRRIHPYRGELTITEDDRVLLRKEVGLAFDALFGPDVDDVATWEEEALRFVDGRTDS